MSTKAGELHFYFKRLRTGEETADWAREWMDRHAAAAASLELRADHLLEVASRVAPRNEDIADFRKRLTVDGIRAERLRGAKKILAVRINATLQQCDTLAGAIRAGAQVAALTAAHESSRLVASDAAYVVRRVFAVHPGMNDADARERVLARIIQLRHTADDDARRGLYLLTCHQSKGKEFDVVVLPYLSSTIFDRHVRRTAASLRDAHPRSHGDPCQGRRRRSSAIRADHRSRLIGMGPEPGSRQAVRAVPRSPSSDGESLNCAVM